MLTNACLRHTAHVRLRSFISPLRFDFLPAAVRDKRGTNSKCTSKISFTHLAHIHTYPSTGGWCESDRRKLQERSAWANGRGSLHDITPDTFDRSFNVTTQPLTPTTDVTRKPGRVCRTWTRMSMCMCAFCISANQFRYKQRFSSVEIKPAVLHLDY